MADNWATPNGADNGWTGGEGSNDNGSDWNSGPAGNGVGEAAPADDAEAKQKREEYHQKAREAGWTESTAFDYAEFQRAGGMTALPFIQRHLS